MVNLSFDVEILSANGNKAVSTGPLPKVLDV